MARVTLTLTVLFRLLYERVPLRKSAEMMLLHLDDPVTEFLPLRGASRRHELTELPMGNLMSPSKDCNIRTWIFIGKYIVCGEAMTGGRVYQTSCFETRVERLEPDSELYLFKLIKLINN